MLFPIFPFLYYVYEIFSHSRNLIPIYPRSPSPHSIVVLLLVLYHTCYALEPLTQTPRELSHVVKRLCNSSSTHAVTQHWWRKCTCMRAELFGVRCMLRMLWNSSYFSVSHWSHPILQADNAVCVSPFFLFSNARTNAFNSVQSTIAYRVHLQRHHTNQTISNSRIERKFWCMQYHYDRNIILVR